MRTYRYIVYAALAAAVLLCGCGKKAPEPVEPEEPVPTVATEESQSVLCSDGSMTLRFRRNDEDAWQWVDDVSFPLDGQYVDQLVETARELDALAPVSGAEAPEAYGLVGSRCYLTVSRSDGSEVTYYLGNKTEDGSGYYCNSTDDEKRIRVAPERVMSQLGRSIYDMALLPDLSGLTADTIKAVTIIRGDASDQLTLSRGKWMQGGQNVTEQAHVQQLVGALENMSLLRCVDYAPASGAAAVCGLDAPQAVLRLELDKKELTLSVGGCNEAEKAYFVTVDEDPTIYLMGGDLPALLVGWPIGG